MNALLEHLLTARISLLLSNTLTAGPGREQSDSVVATDRLIFLTQGRLSYHIEDQPRIMEAGDLWLIPAWTRRSWQAQASVGCSLAWVEFALHPAMPTGLPCIELRQASAELQSLYAQVRQNLKQPGPDAPLLAEMALKHLLVLLLAGHRDMAYASVGRGLPQAAAWLRDHLHEPDALQRLFDSAEVSPAKLRASFRSATGMSPADYLQSLRMHKARYLLTTTHLSVKETAARVGYADPLYFSRRYRQFWRHAPTAERAPNP